MLIRYKIVAWFIFLVSMVMLLFSIFVYSSFEKYRKDSIENRLKRRALSTSELLTPDGKVSGTITNTLPEQVDLIYSDQDSLIYSNVERNDFYPSKSFLDSAKHQGVIHFTYLSPGHEYPKDGVAVTYRHNGENNTSRSYVALVTAYDLEGYQRLFSLRDIFIFGNIFFVLLIGGIAYFFAISILQPLHSLFHQINERHQASISFRLDNFNPNNEIGTLALAFNELLEQHESLIENQRAFISQASHELRTPMTTLKGLLETSILYDKDTDSLIASISKATRELDRLVSLTNGLLQLARVENEESVINTHQIDIVGLMMDSVEAVQDLWSGQHISLRFSDGVLQQDRLLLIKGESTLLKVAFCNLLDNACKYSQGKTVIIEMEMNTENNIAILIKDKGIGIPADEQQKILQPLMRASNSIFADGFGIGLTLAYKVINLHKGVFRIKSELNQGTQVFMEFNLIKN